MTYLLANQIESCTFEGFVLSMLSLRFGSHEHFDLELVVRKGLPATPPVALCFRFAHISFR